MPEHADGAPGPRPPDWPPALIPTDDDVESGQRPFTDFGQYGYGHLDKRVLGQDVYWINIAGVPFFLVDMSPQYRRNVIGFLRTCAEQWWIEELCWDYLDALYQATMREPDDTIRAPLDHAALLEELGPQGWIEATPLMQRLRKLTPEADGP